ncbi:MAG: hypothetical protein E6G97_18635 [Alphaproteobacteria bacterium]|nr:MAG: hypothetical protein E6G97_18635 [Alphaproteobacteria bacterium]
MSRDTESTVLALLPPVPDGTTGQAVLGALRELAFPCKSATELLCRVDVLLTELVAWKETAICFQENKLDGEGASLFDGPYEAKLAYHGQSIGIWCSQPPRIAGRAATPVRLADVAASDLFPNGNGFIGPSTIMTAAVMTELMSLYDLLDAPVVDDSARAEIKKRIMETYRSLASQAEQSR